MTEFINAAYDSVVEGKIHQKALFRRDFVLRSGSFAQLKNMLPIRNLITNLPHVYAALQ